MRRRQPEIMKSGPMVAATTDPHDPILPAVPLSLNCNAVLPQSATASARMHLVERLAQVGLEDKDAFRDVYVLTSAKLFGICLGICGDRSSAEDVLHDVYMVVWKRAGSYEHCLGSPITWLATIARNRAIDWRRSQARYSAVSLDEATDIPDPKEDAETTMLLNEATRQVFTCLEKLEARQRNAIQSAFFHGFTYAELAERDRVPVGTMKSWIRRGLLHIRRSLEKVEP